MRVYPAASYQSWISENDADVYFDFRLKSDEWHGANKDAALVMAFNDINTLLNLDIDLSEDDTPLEFLKAAQCEQAYHLISTDFDKRQVDSFSMGSNLFVKLGSKREPQIAARVAAILCDYVLMRTIERTR